MVSLKDRNRKHKGVLPEGGDERVSINFYLNKNESKKDKKMWE